jgi:hypothetical protein
MNRIFLKELDQFTNQIKNSSISNYFNLGDHIKCTIESNGIQTRIFSISYEDVFKLDCLLTYPLNYPFNPVVWSLHSIIIKEDIQQFDIEEYYTNIISNHNSQYTHSWCPAYYLEKDMLEFIQKINHFEYIIDNMYIANNKFRIIFKNIVEVVNTDFLQNLLILKIILSPDLVSLLKSIVPSLKQLSFTRC